MNNAALIALDQVFNVTSASPRPSPCSAPLAAHSDILFIVFVDDARIMFDIVAVSHRPRHRRRDRSRPASAHRRFRRPPIRRAG